MRRALLAAGALLLTLLGTACDGSGKVTLTVYNGQHPQLTSQLISAFESSTGIDVRTTDDDSVVLAQRLLQEGRNSPADVFIAENSPELMLLDEHGLLGPLSAATLSQVPASDSSPAGHWVGTAARVGALVYNPGKIAASDLPSSILDLAGPAWKGRVALAPGDSDFVPVVGAVIALHGEASAASWLAGLKDTAATYQDDEAVTAAVDRGDQAVGVINSYYWYRLLLEKGPGNVHSAVSYFARGDAGGVRNIAGAAVVAASRHAAEAERLVAFMVSAQGQQILASGDDFEYPIRPGIAANHELPPLTEVNATVIDVATLGDDQAAARLIQRAGLA